MRITDCTTMGPYTILVFSAPLPRTSWRAIMVEGVRYETLPVMDAGNDCLAIAGSHDLAGKDATFIE